MALSFSSVCVTSLLPPVIDESFVLSSIAFGFNVHLPPIHPPSQTHTHSTAAAPANATTTAQAPGTSAAAPANATTTAQATGTTAAAPANATTTAQATGTTAAAPSHVTTTAQALLHHCNPPDTLLLMMMFSRLLRCHQEGEGRRRQETSG